MTPSIVISSGEPAGIGPDICLAASMQPFPARLAFVADPDLVASRARLLGLEVDIREIVPDDELPVHCPGVMQILPDRAPCPTVPGRLNPLNGAHVTAIIDEAINRCSAGKCDAMVTAPVQKSVINDAGIPFTGHTEWIAARTGTEYPVMMLANDRLRVCLATTHIPLRQVPESITEEGLCRTLDIIHSDMKRLFGIGNSRIAVCGLNPHAGEAGHLGSDEADIIEPAIARMKNEGLHIVGPVPADTAFTARSLGGYDVILAMYHDQGLPVIKHSGFGEIVNITMGLPIIRTSVDHGTALDLAGTGRAEHSSLCAAIDMAIDFARRRACTR
ncbi:MAG: 4-hydroxythreonine-4-phosphate dehydrogenase PdxA [Gammaproteobacteria bacterium]|nr:4-hydroxythreonine-4-phosphate dehydrogenase PdxA [Gammaproteobacteria bacterium]MYD76093.1 4-hydroxythreonine-4-phosphate dehydrogenase PdxA [Gammaproteobacteria bacterium]MYJ51260.1 4-hydroxythreonine-4-phosphate dehydrogenase PdxA [Gammaproteobacteria bacterium]